jgi:DinB superfamily
MDSLTFETDEVVEALRSSLATIEWATRVLPPQWTNALREHYPPDSWTVTMNLAHMVLYEERLAVPMLESLAEGNDGTDRVQSVSEQYPDAVLLAEEPMDELMRRLRAARERQLAIVGAMDARRLNAPATEHWGKVDPNMGARAHSAGWVAMKTFQHTWDHGNAILRMALFAPR